jgi:Flp pilus assembly pilin Flp
MIQLLKNLLKEESGQDIIEYILVAALITAGVVAVVTKIGAAVNVLWTNLSAQIP